MNRRNLIQLLFVGSIGSIIPFKARANNTSSKIQYKDFEIYWTGWKQFPDSIKICGQWVAHSKKKMWGEFGYDILNICANAPNKCGADQFLIGATFNISGGLYVESTDEEKEFEKSKAY